MSATPQELKERIEAGIAGSVAEVTGDKQNDLIVVVHNRILVYPQE